MIIATRVKSVLLVACTLLSACRLAVARPSNETAFRPGGDDVPAPRAESAREHEPSHRRALLVGIDDYSASHIPRTAADRRAPAPGRSWPDLGGAVRDVSSMREMLIARYGFEARDIVVLSNQAATRAAILKAIEEHLVKPAGKNYILLFYYAGHGSQVANSSSDEPDKMDESIIPADSRLGALDIRDKELRRLANRMLDQGARSTVILDSCHSGSGMRGLPTGANPRGIKADHRDVADGENFGPRPEDRGALVLSATQDFDYAWETRDERGELHGAFSWALARAMRDAAPGEPAAHTFLRAQARLRCETPYQDPVMAGNDEARSSPLFEDRKGTHSGGAVVAVEKTEADGTVILQGGWANGLTVGSKLRPGGEDGENVRLEVTEMLGLGRCKARFVDTRQRSTMVRSGSLLKIVEWAAPPGKPLRVWMPQFSGDEQPLAAFANALAHAAARRTMRWIEDPIVESPAYVVRWRDREWELLAPGSAAERLGTRVDAESVVARIPEHSSLFLQLPAPASLVQEIGLRSDSEYARPEPTDRPEDADYILTGRLSQGRIEYAFIRPTVKESDRHGTALPLRTAWRARGDEGENSALSFRIALSRLVRIYAWHQLSSPPDALFAYQIAVRPVANDEKIQGGTLTGQHQYGFVLRARSTLPASIEPRYVYVFLIDSYGQGVLLFPIGGSVENRFPLTDASGRVQSHPPAEITLGAHALFEVGEPYGVDTYFLLTSEEPLPDPSILNWDGVRGRQPSGTNPLERLLNATDTARRSGVPLRTFPNWSIDRVILESVAPGASDTTPSVH